MTRDQIKSLALQIKDAAEAAEPSIDRELGTAAAAAFEAYLSGQAASLDAAFGLKRKPGRPSGTGSAERLGLYHDAHARKASGATWENVAAEVDPRDVMEESTVRKGVDRNASRIAERIGRHLAKRMKSGN